MKQGCSIKRGGRTPVRVVAVFAIVALTAMVAPASGQQAPQFRSTVEVVQMQVMVADSRGDYIPRLRAEDFRLRVDGGVREITAAYEIDLRKTPALDLETDDFIPAAGFRQFLLFFDFSFSSRRGLLRARDSAAEFVRDHTHPKDLIGVATYSNTQGLKLVSPFTSDRGQVLDSISGFGLNRAGYLKNPAGFAVRPIQEMLEAQSDTINSNAASGDISSVARDVIVESVLFASAVEVAKTDFRRYREEVGRYAQSLVDLGALLTATRGRKHVVLFSSGFDDKVMTGQSLEELSNDSALVQAGNTFAVNSETRFGSADLRETLADALDNLRAADTVFHAFDTSGLASYKSTSVAESSDSTFRGITSGKQGLAYLADGTKGSLTWNTNDLMPALANLAEETSRYYVIAYRKQAGDPPVVDIDVEVLRQGAKVVAAPTRLAPPPPFAEMDEAQKMMQLAEFVTKRIEHEDMTFDVSTAVFEGTPRVSRVAVVVEVPYQQLERIAVERGDGKTELDILGYIIGSDGQMKDVFSSRATLDVDGMADHMKGLPLRYYGLLWSNQGEHEVRVLVRDAQVGLLSTRTEAIDVPRFAGAPGLLVSGPVAIDAAHPGMLMRGFEDGSPPAHRAGGPVGYPFMMGDQMLTPQVYTLTPAGGSCYFLLVAHNLGQHPFTGQSQARVTATAIDQTGTSHVLAGVRLVQRHDDADGKTTSLLVEARMPSDLTAGAYLLEIKLVDTISGETVDEILPFLVTPETGD